LVQGFNLSGIVNGLSIIRTPSAALLARQGFAASMEIPMVNVATAFTPIASLMGGALIGLSAVMLMSLNGRIAGVSGIAIRLLPPYADSEFAGRLAFVAGLIMAPVVVLVVTGRLPAQTIQANSAILILAGVLVGFGSVWGNGCTSGHGVCGLSRLSMRSLVATMTFMAAGIVTVFIARHLG
jgi:uncharacterized membrane protein YedE/YeeE